jgi:phage tail sheath gpL-like
MPIDQSAIASVTGIETTYVQLGGGAAAVLPPRIAVFAQGQTGVTFPSSKATYTSAGAAGKIHGFRSAIYLMLRELLPSNGDGVGVIPVTVYPLTDAVGATAATGDITPSGTTSEAGTYQLRVGGVLSQAFGVPAGAVDVNLTLAKMGFALSSVLHMPVTTTYSYGSVSASALSGTGNGTITSLTVAAPALPGQYKLVLNTVVANGGVWTLTDPLGNVLSTSITMTPGVGGATPLTVNGLGFTLTDGTTDFGLGATFTITVPATKINTTFAWKGTSGNSCKIELIGPNVGLVLAVTALAGGTVDPDVQPALDKMGGVWEVFCLNGLPIANTTALDAYSAFGEGKWGVTAHQPLVFITGTTHSTVPLATAISSTRKTDRVNVEIPAPGSPALPIVIAARSVARISVIAGSDPSSDYCGLPLSTTGIVAGDDAVQWDWPTRDQALKLGCSTTEVIDNVVQLADIISMYAPTGEDPPGYRHLKDIVKVMNIIFNIALICNAPKWKRAALVPSTQVLTNPNARKPSSLIADLSALADDLGKAAIISDPESTKKQLTAMINSGNPNRIDATELFKLSGNTKIKMINLLFGFFYGTPALVA